MFDACYLWCCRDLFSPSTAFCYCVVYIFLTCHQHTDAHQLLCAMARTSIGGRDSTSELPRLKLVGRPSVLSILAICTQHIQYMHDYPTVTDAVIARPSTIPVASRESSSSTSSAYEERARVCMRIRTNHYPSKHNNKQQ